MAFSIYSALWAVNGVRSPQTNHSLLFRRRPKKNDVASRIAICKRQADNSSIKLPRQFGVRDRKVGFVEMHTAKASTRSFLDQQYVVTVWIADQSTFRKSRFVVRYS